MAVKGLAKFEARWKAVPRIVRKNMRAELEDIADDLVAQMFSQAPMDTGDLAGSIGWTWGDAPAGSMTIGTVQGTNYGALRITIYAGDEDTFYARFQEFGTIDMPASPFFFPVYRVNRKRIRSRMSRALSRAAKLA